MHFLCPQCTWAAEDQQQGPPRPRRGRLTRGRTWRQKRRERRLQAQAATKMQELSRTLNGSLFSGRKLDSPPHWDDPCPPHRLQQRVRAASWHFQHPLLRASRLCHLEGKLDSPPPPCPPHRLQQRVRAASKCKSMPMSHTAPSTPTQ